MALQNTKPKAKEEESHIIKYQEKQSPPICRAVVGSTKMEEMMIMMMKIKNNPPNNIIPNNIPNNIPIAPAWKLYENPFYISHQKPQEQDYSADHKEIHRLNLPISARKIAASFRDLTFIKPFTESELEMARAQISELKAELECERKLRKKMECLNKKIGREMFEERKGREALERVCEQLAKEISAQKSEIIRMKKEMDDERKMLRTAEVIREERVQMKLAEAKIVLEERLSELEISKKMGPESSSSSSKKVNHQEANSHHATFGEKIRFVLGEKMSTSVNSIALRKSCAEAENPHIKRGIKGFVEFPKVVRAIGCRSSKHLGSKLECQKAQLKILLKQKGHVRLNGLIAS